MATAKESVPLVEHISPTVRFADDSIDIHGEEIDTPSSSSDDANSFTKHFPEFARYISLGSDPDSDFEELDGLPDVEFPGCQGFDVTDAGDTSTTGTFLYTCTCT